MIRRSDTFEKKYTAKVEVVKPRMKEIASKSEAIIIQLPKTYRGSSHSNMNFVKMCDFIVDDTNILTIGFNGNERTVATLDHIADYIGVTKGTMGNVFSRYSSENIIMRCITGKVVFYMINPLYAYHKNGVSETVATMFENMRDKTLAKELSNMKSFYKNKL